MSPCHKLVIDMCSNIGKTKRNVNYKCEYIELTGVVKVAAAALYLPDVNLLCAAKRSTCPTTVPRSSAIEICHPRKPRQAGQTGVSSPAQINPYHFGTFRPCRHYIFE